MMQQWFRIAHLVEVALDHVDVRGQGLEIVKHVLAGQIASADDVLNLAGYLRGV